MNFAEYRIYLILFVLGVTSWILADFFDEQAKVDKKIVSHSPDYFSVNYYKKEMDIDGLVKNELNADKMIHYSDDGKTHLENPVMTLHNSDASPWVIKSKTGILEADGDHLLLAGDVFISRARAKKLKPFIINTSELRVKLSTSYAETDQWGEIIDNPNRTEGVGLQATFVKPVKIKFLSKVKGRYEFN
ncbi:MAG: LPS export ABC transporter periplasmic protein LptC [Methylococcales bacterium]|nr:LPS export ABC transporter periplasmic protein LptC [Methylococcales bacterium]